MLYSRDEDGQDWIRTEAILAGSGLDPTAIFSKIGGQDWIGLRTFCCFYVIIPKISKILVVIRFHRFAKW